MVIPSHETGSVPGGPGCLRCGTMTAGIAYISSVSAGRTGSTSIAGRTTAPAACSHWLAAANRPVRRSSQPGWAVRRVEFCRAGSEPRGERGESQGHSRDLVHQGARDRHRRHHGRPFRPARVSPSGSVARWVCSKSLPAATRAPRLPGAAPAAAPPSRYLVSGGLASCATHAVRRDAQGRGGIDRCVLPWVQVVAACAPRSRHRGPGRRRSAT